MVRTQPIIAIEGQPVVAMSEQPEVDCAHDQLRIHEGTMRTPHSARDGDFDRCRIVAGRIRSR